MRKTAAGGDGTMIGRMGSGWKGWLAPVAMAAALCMLGGCKPDAPVSAPPQTTPIDAEGARSIDRIGDLLAASEFQVFSINSKSQHVQTILKTQQPISSLSYTSEHTVITVFDPNDPKAFRGFYLRDRDTDSFTQIPTPSMAPKFSYVNGDLLFLAAADRTVQKDGEHTRVGIISSKSIAG
ncbi:hypothetical protein O9H85_18420 [Paenibacillus filicis]|uniref:Uncharacterized protein n=1 Tax=Paenibacillus gyeongsangnamensis TaxID=3388067 RepID=A0ABT4QBU3_9BACL|nr:hypothetical protein [Paenibacillus filicis]MCZ8514362.1 hypothetical protein [Paenibacillus filicis]